MPYLASEGKVIGGPPPVEEEIPPPEYNFEAAEPYGGGGAIPPPPAPVASEYYGGEMSAMPAEGTPPAASYDYRLASDPNLVQTTYPSTGEQTTHRYIPPEGSTYPVVERDRSLPPAPTMQELQDQWYPRAYPDIEAYSPGEGGRDAPPPPEGKRYVPAAVHDNLFHQYHAGEGAMGRGDPLDPRNTLDDGRPILNYRPGVGTPSGYTRYRPGWGGRVFLETAAAQGGGPPLPPPGYVPELIRFNGQTVSSRDMERSTPRRLSPTSMPPPPNQPPLPPRGGSPENTAYTPQSLADVLAWMERARQERQRRWALAGLFGGGG